MAERWPFFDQHFPLEELEATVAYRDPLLLLLLGLFLLCTTLYGYARWHKSESIQVVTVVVALFQALFVSASLTTLLIAPSSEAFWHRTLYHTFAIALLFLLSTAILFWVWRTFSTRDRCREWFYFYFSATATLGALLYLPLLLLLLFPCFRILALLLTALLYLLFRISLGYYALRIFSHLLRYPLHIILYLCACEIAPIVYLLHGLI